MRYSNPVKTTEAGFLGSREILMKDKYLQYALSFSQRNIVFARKITEIFLIGTIEQPM